MKVLVIGLDGATWNVLDDFLLDNYMPNLKKLKDSGYSGILQSTEPPTTPTAWQTFLTGCNPSKHKVFGFRKYSSFEKNSLTLVNASDCRVPNILQELSWQGYKVASINMPYTYPCPEVNGIVVAGFGSPGPTAQITFPIDFKDELLTEIPDYDVLAHCDWSSADTDYEQFEKNIKLMERSFQQRLDAAKLVNKKMNLDVMMVQFSEIDSLHHHVWDYVAKALRDKYPHRRDRLFKMFEKLDAVIGEIVTYNTTDELLIMVVSDHGGGRLIGDIRPNILLQQWGHLKPKSPLTRMVSRQIDRWQRKLDLLMGREPEKQPDKMNVDWKRSKAVLIHNATNGYIYVNLKGRQPWGSVEAGPECQAVIEDLKAKFLQMTIPETGEPMFLNVVTPGELYGFDGTNSEDVGDLILIPHLGYNLRKSTSKRKSHIQMMPSCSLKGTHRYEGIYLFSGSNVKASNNVEAAIVNLAPTIYAALGAKLPSYLDGKVMREIFTENLNIEYLEDSGQTDSINQHRKELSRQEQEIVSKRLAELGYL